MMSLSKAYDLLTIILSLILLLKVTSTASLRYAKPGCNDTCGNDVRIPFPFGIGANCALNEWYLIYCNSSTPYLSAPALNHLEVVGVDLLNQTVTVNTPTSVSDCGYRSLLNSSSLQIKSVDLDDRSPFEFSVYLNKLVVEGCGNVVISHNGTALSGCSSICRNDSSTVREKSSCFGLTCCETKIPDNRETTSLYPLKSYTVELTGLETHDRGSCGSAFFVDENLYVEGRFGGFEGGVVVPVSLVWDFTELDFQQISCCDGADMRYSGYGASQTRVRMANGTVVDVWMCRQYPEVEGNIYLRDGCAVKKECVSCRANGGYCYYGYGLKFTCETRHPDVYPASKKLSLGVILGTFRNMSREALAIGSDSKPPVLFRGDYAQWKDRFEDFIESKENGHLILQSYRDGPATYDEEAPPNPLVAAGTVPPAPRAQVVLRTNLPLKDKPRKTAEELERVKADRQARSYLLQGLTNEIYTHVDSYKDAKSMWDEIAKQMQGSELSSSAKITKVLTEYEGFKQSTGEILIDTYNRYCTLLNDIRRNDLVKSKLEINIKFLKNLRPEWKSHAMNVMADKFFKDMDIHDVLEKLQLFQEDIDGVQIVQQSVDSQVSDPLALVVQKRHSSSSSKVSKTDYHVDDKSNSDSDNDDDEVSKAMALLTTAMQRRFYKKPANNQQRTSSFSKRPEYQSKPPSVFKPEPVSSTSSAKAATKADQRACFNCNKVGHLAKDCRAPKVRDSNYYKNKMLLAKQQEAGSALLADDAEWLTLTDEETEDLEVNMCYMGKIQQVDSIQDPDAPVSTSCSEDDEV